MFAARVVRGSRTMSVHVEEPSETPSCRGSSGGDIAGDFVLVEHAPDGRQEFRELFGELGLVLSHLGKRDELFADQVVESTLRAEAALDPLRRPALLRPDLLEPHAETIAIKTRGMQSFTLGHGSGMREGVDGTLNATDFEGIHLRKSPEQIEMTLDKCHLDHSGANSRRIAQHSAQNEREGERTRVSLISCEMLSKNAELGDSEREGVVKSISRNTNRHGRFSSKPHDAANLAFADSFIRFRPFACVCRFLQRNDTRNDTRRGGLGRQCPRASSAQFSWVLTGVVRPKEPPDVRTV